MRPHRTLVGALVMTAALVSLSAHAEEDDAAAPVDVPGFWTDAELARIDEGLAVVNATRADLGFQKQPIDDPFRLDVVRRALDDPLSVGREASRWDAVARSGDVNELLTWSHFTLFGTSGVIAGAVHDGWAAGAGLPEPAYEALSDLLRHVHWTKRFLASDDFLGDADERRRLLEKALRTQVESPDGAEPGDLLGDDEFRTAIATARRKMLQWHTTAIVMSTAELTDVLRSLPADSVLFEGHRTFTQKGVTLRFAGRENDRHEGTDVDVLIDLGGDDTYTHGASVNALTGGAVSVVIDLSGNDRSVGENDFAMGGALGGVAVHWDGGGDDMYVTGHCSQGAGLLGVGVLVDEGGDDVFRGGDFCQGAGAFGVGILLKKGGNDLYHADLFGQGFASTWGCGVLVDLAGNDVYDAGGEHLHAPLYRDRYQALSQGFAIGMRPDMSGGVGVLVDVSGNDRYQTDIYGQGSSYWYALGLLIDDDGHDTYNGTHYCQGTGIHLSAGMLLDRAGNDAYYCLNGVGIGGAHDFAVGFLVDRGGDDRYTGSGGSQGGALTNSVAMLLDESGNDGYCAVRGASQGSARPARDTGGIGLLLDGAGGDVYTEKTRNDAAWVKDVVGAGIDQVTPEARDAGPQAAAITQEEATKRVEEECRVEKDGELVWDLDKLWALCSAWEVNDNRIVMPIARERLFELGAPVLDRAFERIGTKDGLEYRAVEATLRHFPRDEVVPRLLDATRSDDERARRGAVRVVGALVVPEAYDRLVEMLADEGAARRSALGALRALKRAPPEVVELLASDNELEGVSAATCLSAVGDEAAIAALAGALSESTPFLVRTAATEQLAKLGAAAIPSLERLAREDAAPLMARRNALRALGKSAMPEAADCVVELLGATDRWLRLSAMQACGALVEKLDEAGAERVSAALAAAREREEDPLLRRLR